MRFTSHFAPAPRTGARPNQGDRRLCPRLELPNTQVYTAADVGLGMFPLPPFVVVDPGMLQPFVQPDTVRYVGDIVAVCHLGEPPVLLESTPPSW